MHGQGDVEDERRKRLFKGLRFFFGREVPKSWLEFVVVSCGGTVGWEGEGSPFTLEDSGITHQVMDRPTMTGPRRKRREYVQPQWLLDSLNARMLLPVARYAPGAVLPPHLSPFVDDAAEGYVPAYREELDGLRSAAEARRKEDLVPGEGRQDEEGVVERNVGDDVAEGGDGVGERVGEDGGGGDVEAAFARDLERERAGTSFSEASKKKQRRRQEEDDAEGEEDDNDEDDDDDDDDEGDVEEEGEDEGGDEETIGEAAPLEANEMGAQTENEEHHELSKTMMSKKAKRLYGRMQHGLSKRREEIEKLKAKRKKLEAKYDATPNMAKANSTSAKKRRKLTKKNRSSSGAIDDAGND